jgi:hypothetical protein
MGAGLGIGQQQASRIFFPGQQQARNRYQEQHEGCNNANAAMNFSIPPGLCRKFVYWYFFHNREFKREKNLRSSGAGSF